MALTIVNLKIINQNKYQTGLIFQKKVQTNMCQHDFF